MDTTIPLINHKLAADQAAFLHIAEWYTHIKEPGLFLPATREEMNLLGWDHLDAILVSGDSYIDTPYSGIAVIGRLLENAGYRVGVIAQPDITSDKDIARLGEPSLFWGVSGGTVDSMVANYTATLRKRHNDDFTPGGKMIDVRIAQ